MKKEQNQAQLGRFVKIVKDFPNRAKISKNDRAGSVEKVKNGNFPNLAKRGQGGGLSQKGAKSSTVGALCENCEGFSKVGKN